MKIQSLNRELIQTSIKRSLEFLAVAAWFIAAIFAGPFCYGLTVFIFLGGFPWINILIVAYLAFLYYDRNVHWTGGRSERITSCNRSIGNEWCWLFEDFPGLNFSILTLNQHFLVPIFREYVLAFGTCSCDEKSIDNLLSINSKKTETGKVEKGRAVVLIVGGASEAFESRPNTYKILLKRRKGFIRVALKNGAPLVPVFSFGETDIYDQVNNPEGSLLRKFQEYIKKKVGIAPIIPIGRGFFQYSFGFVPKRKPIFVVVGRPIETPKIEHPTQEEINEYHAKFTEELINLFETHKTKYLNNAEKISLVLCD
uniref:Acyltransferase n=1 Tax=Trichogramma kaykai TaxID=54128 RepID=A0ABD2XKC2_9HYME